MSRIVKTSPSTEFTVERRAVERYRALLGDETGNLVRSANSKMRHAVEVTALDDFGHAIDVAADEVAAEFVADL